MEEGSFIHYSNSMGAVTALLYSAKNNFINCVIADSPFANLKQLAVQLVQKEYSMPEFLIEGILTLIDNTIQSKTELSLDKIDLSTQLKQTKVPALFVISEDDELIPREQILQIVKNYGCSKTSIYAKGTHNSERSATDLQKIIAFIVQHQKIITPDYCRWTPQRQTSATSPGFRNQNQLNRNVSTTQNQLSSNRTFANSLADQSLQPQKGGTENQPKILTKYQGILQNPHKVLHHHDYRPKMQILKYTQLPMNGFFQEFNHSYSQNDFSVFSPSIPVQASPIQRHNRLRIETSREQIRSSSGDQLKQKYLKGPVLVSRVTQFGMYRPKYQ